MEYIIMGIVTALNLIFIKMKIELGRYGDAVLDVISFIVITKILGGSMGGMFVGMVASFIISVYLYYNPPELSFDEGF